MSNSYYPTLKELADKLGAKKHQGYYLGRCPAHDDDTASLSIAEKKGKIVFKCHAGCPQDAVMDALRQKKFWPERNSNGQAGPHRTIVATYDYENANGELLFQAVRLAPKGFYQRRPDGKGGWINNLKGVRCVPYRLRELNRAIAERRIVLIVEGEKDCENLAKLDVVATCNAGGAGKWKAEHSAPLKGAHVVILPDNDGPGRQHAESVAASLDGIAECIQIVNLPNLPEKGDASDWIAAGGDVEQLFALIEATQDWQPNVPPRAAKQEQSPGNDHASDEVFPYWLVERWHEVVQCADLLDEMTAILERYMVLPDHAARVIALWVLHAWTIDCYDISPFLFLSSPTKQCGKTTLLTMLLFLTPRSVAASNISAAALYRFVEEFKPTLLIDEADSFARDNEELRNVLNAGHTRTTALTVRCETIGREIKPRAYSTWAPKVIAAIGTLSGTVMDRSIIVSLRRKKKTETREKLRLRDNDDFIRIRRRAKRWAEDNVITLSAAEPTLPAGIANRAEDNWLPLFAIAQLAGREWPARVVAAASAFTSGGQDSDVSIQLLSDIRHLFHEKHRGTFGAEELMTALICLPESPWAEWRQGKDGGTRAITSRGVALMLQPFGIASEKTRGPRIYKRADFEEAWNSYLPPLSPPYPPD